MKLTDYIVSPIMETGIIMQSTEYMELRIKFSLLNATEAYCFEMAEWINEHFVVDFLDEFYIEAESRDKRNVSGTKFLKVFEKEMKKHGNSTFCYGAAKYTDTFSTKKSIMKEREKLNFVRIDDEKEHRDTIEHLLFESTSEQMLFDKIIEVEKRRQVGTVYYDTFLDFSICHVFKNMIMGGVVFKIATNSIGTNLDKVATLLKQYLLEFCEKFSVDSGVITLGNWSDDYWEEKKYFEEIPTGSVVDEAGREYWIDDWMDIHYIDELAWFNIFSKKIGERLKEIEKLENGATYRFSTKGKMCILESLESIKEHKRKMYKDIYPCFEKCLRPGFSVWKLTEIRPFWEDLYFPSTQYRIKGNKVYFSRGVFDFVEGNGETLLDDEEERFYMSERDWDVPIGKG